MAISKRLRYEILRRDNHACRYCGATAPDVKLTVDHVVPVALGGTDDPTNLITACAGCNSGKTSSTPDAALVADVQQDAMRWQMAWNVAVAEAERDGQQRAKDIAKVKRNYVAAYRGRHDSDPILPSGWEASVGRWLDLGLTVAMIDKAISSAVGRTKIRAQDRWAYFAGCCWGLLRELGNRATQIAKARELSWDERVTAAVIDTAVLVWRTYWMQAHGADPAEGLEDEVREYAQEIYPDDVTPAQLLAAAQTAAEVETSAISDFIDPDEYDDELEEFEVRIARAFALGWIVDSQEAVRPDSFTPEQFQPILAQALAANMAGYQDISVRHAAYEAARSGSMNLFADLSTIESVLSEYGDHIPENAARICPTQNDLDSYLSLARAEHKRTLEARARHAAECPGCGWCGPTDLSILADGHDGDGE